MGHKPYAHGVKQCKKMKEDRTVRVLNSITTRIHEEWGLEGNTSGERKRRQEGRKKQAKKTVTHAVVSRFAPERQQQDRHCRSSVFFGKYLLDII